MRLGEIAFRELLPIVRSRADRAEPYSIYSKASDYDRFSLDTRVYLAPTHDKVPADVEALGLAIFCHDFLLQDVVDHALGAYDDVTDEDLFAGLENYLVHDAFMDYDTGETSGQGGRAIWGGGRFARVGRPNPDGTVKPPRL